VSTDLAAAQVIALLMAGAAAGVLGAAVLCLLLWLLLGAAARRPRRRTGPAVAKLQGRARVEAETTAAARAAAAEFGTRAAALVGAAGVRGGRHHRPQPRAGRVDDAP